MDIYKEKIKEKLKQNIEYDNIDELIEIPKELSCGNYSIVCFKLAKTLRKSPNDIANELKQKLGTVDGVFEKSEVVNRYLNFYVSKEEYAKHIISNIKEIVKDKYEIGSGKNVCIDYSSPNVAKDFHIGHLRTTLIGFALYNLFKTAGYNINSINHLGDYGTQFGKLIEGYKLFGQDMDFSQNPIEKLTQIYVKISELSKKDENVLNACRQNFKLLEQKDPYCLKLYEYFKELSFEEPNKVYNMLGITFDSWKGESFYVDKMQEVFDILEKNKKLEISQGATIVNLEQDGIETPLMIKKSDGTSTYATRDLAAILYRSRTYDYDKSIYVTSNEQILHFKQVFATAKYLDLDEKYVNGLTHVSYGMVLLPTGKMSTRGGNVVKLIDLFNDAINEAKKIIEQKNPELEDKEEIAKKVGIGAVIFNDLSTSTNKDEVFKLEDILNFQGETGPYIQYTYVRIKSIIDKYLKKHNLEEIIIDDEIDFSVLTDDKSQALLQQIFNYENIICQTLDKLEPSIFARYVLNLAKLFAQFYNENIVLSDDKIVEKTRIVLINIVKDVLEKSCNIMGIHMPDKM